MQQDRVSFTSLELHNYKAFSSYSISLQDMNVLVGTNNCGKSTLVGLFRALDVAFRRARTRNPEYLYGPKSYTFGYNLSEDSFPISLENVHTDYKDVGSTVTFRLSNGNKLLLYFPADGGWMLIPETKEERPVRSVRDFKDAFPVSIIVVPVLGPVEHHEQLVQEETVQRNLSTHLASRHFRNYWYYSQETFRPFAALVRASWPGMEILKPERVEPGSPELSMYCLENRITRELFWAGFGFQIWCQLLTHLCRAENSTVVVVDEPEVYLHPDVQRQLLSMLRALKTDVLLASHSSEIIAEADPSEIVVVDKAKTSAKRLRDHRSVQDVLARIGSVQNLTLTRLARNRTLLFTEGDRDFDLLRHFARKVGLYDLASGVGLTPLTSDGFSSMERVKSLRWGLEKTLAQHLAIGAIYDRDYYCPEEIGERLSALWSEITYAHVHERKELENYLLVPAALQRALDRELSERYRRTGEAPIPKETIVDMLHRLSNPHKAELLSQYVARRSTYLQKSKKDAATIARETIDWFDAKWAVIDQRMEVVAGKDLLAAVRGEVQDSYGVSLTAHKVIEAFRVDEVPSDLIELLHGLDKLRTPAIASNPVATV
jgi:energy-coupling factor transporter ATP-binding protein EcfA2